MRMLSCRQGKDFFMERIRISMKKFEKINKIPMDFGQILSGDIAQTGETLFSLKDQQFSAVESLDSSEYFIFPGFCDVHVHFREPGFSYKETIATGSMAGRQGRIHGGMHHAQPGSGA